MPVPVTLLYGGLCGLLLVGLATNVSRLRGRYHAAVGQVPEQLVRPVRAHANAAENIPIALLLLLALELSGVHTVILHAFGGSLVLGRILHAIGLIKATRLSSLGIALNHGVILAMSVMALVWHFIR